MIHILLIGQFLWVWSPSPSNAQSQMNTFLISHAKSEKESGFLTYVINISQPFVQNEVVSYPWDRNIWLQPNALPYEWIIHETTKDEVSSFLFTNLSSLYLEMNMNSVVEGGIKILFRLTDGQIWINNVKRAWLSIAKMAKIRQSTFFFTGKPFLAHSN